MGYYVSRFGEERTAMIFQRLSQAGAEVGISFKLSGRTGDSRDSHRLIQLGKAKSPSMQTRVVKEVFASFFENEGEITSHQVSQEAGVKAGLDDKEVKEWLKSDKGGPEVDREVAEAQYQ